MTDYSWQPIEDLSPEAYEYINQDLKSLANVWSERKKELQNSEKLKTFNEQLARQWAIETGIIERVYTLDRGITQMLIEQGVDASLIPHGKSDKPAQLVVSIIRDQAEVIDGLFDFVKQERELSTWYIRQMHEVFMRHQPTVEGMNQFGQVVEFEVVRGNWKDWPNNPKRPDGLVHEYAPPEQVASEMDRLIAMHNQHRADNIQPEVEAAWLHHRFTQIHPFQDGNGRIARALASLIFLRAGWFPLVIINDDRADYIAALESADSGNLLNLINLFAKCQISAFRRALGISEEVTKHESVETLIKLSLDKLGQRRTPISAYAISGHLISIVQSRLFEVAQQLTSGLEEIDPNYGASVRDSDGTNDFWYRAQIIQLAKSFGYYASLRDYRAWVHLRIKEQRQASLIYSFHGLGYAFSGLMAVSAFLEFRSSGPDYNEGVLDDPYPICTDIFQFSHNDQPEEAAKRFKGWLEETILIGLDQWRKQL